MQQEIWEAEHRIPVIYPHLAGETPSSGVPILLDWLQANEVTGTGLEICCGKGRNLIAIADAGWPMIGVDFSPTAVRVANERIMQADVDAHVYVHDVTQPYKLTEPVLFAIDYFGVTELAATDRQAAVDQLRTIIKPSGYLITYLTSTDNEFQQSLIAQYPGPERNSCILPDNHKFEKAFDQTDIDELYTGLQLVEHRRIEQILQIDGVQYQCLNHWIVWQLPS